MSWVGSAGHTVSAAVQDLPVTIPASGNASDWVTVFCALNGASGTWTEQTTADFGAPIIAAGGMALFAAPVSALTVGTYTFRRTNTAAAGTLTVERRSLVAGIQDALFTTGSAGSLTLAQVTAAAANTQLAALVTKVITGASAWTPPGSMSERSDQQFPVSTGAQMSVADEVVGSGATGTRAFTTGTGANRGVLIAYIPATAQNVSPGGRASTLALGSPTVLRGAVTVAPGGRASSLAIGSPTVLRGAVNVQPGGIASTAVVGSPTVLRGAVTIAPAGIAPTSAVGAPAVVPGAVTVEPSGIAPTSDVGDPIVTPGAATIAPAGIGSTADVGDPTLVPGAVTIEPPSIAPTTQLGDPLVLSGGTAVAPVGIAPTTQFGTPTISVGPVTIAPSGIPSGAQLGDPTVVPPDAEIGPQGIGSTAAVGEPTVTPGSVTVSPAGIPGGASVGTPDLLATATVQPSGIGPSSAVGTPTVSGPLPQIISPTGIASTATLGEPTVAEPTRPDECWPVDLSCVTWWDDLQGEPPVPVYTEAQKQRAIALGIDALRQLTGYRVGGCPTILRPCKPGCSPETWRTYPVGFGSGVGWQPVLVSGTWLNIGCGCSSDSCSCTSISEVVLPQPIGRISEVKIDGEVIPSTSYRLDPGGRLVRTDGGRWPICQDIGSPDTAEGTWSITVRPGVEPDATAQFMAGVMAGEFLRACRGDSCRLPTGVTQIARLGVTLSVGTGAFPEGRTGIREVDSWLDRWNPNRLRTRATVISPDSRRPRQQGR